MANENIGKLIDVLYETTGIHFALDESLPFDTNESNEEKIKNTILRLGKKLSKASILEKYLSGELTSLEAKDIMSASHYNYEEQYDMYYVSFNTECNNLVLSILRSITNSSSWEILKLSSRTIIMINNVKKVTAQDELKHFAYSLYDTISTEAMVSARVAYDRTSYSFEELPEIYQNLASAVMIGEVFYSGHHIYGYHELGLGKLIYSLSRDAAESFIKDSLPGLDFEQLDNETINTINTFFDCGLNISETGRVLYLHRNTLVYRLDKFSRSTGLDIRNFDDAVKCRVGMMISAYLRNQPLQNEKSDI
ncbi:MAG: helix-turn-helix domain-containing protein [Lachnospiraceae bacterium]|jgi:carbohydrate diacid regulator|nr:helix-turn-helix domain-containing protein [Lachnospiraceae bacterium]